MKSKKLCILFLLLSLHSIAWTQENYPHVKDARDEYYETHGTYLKDPPSKKNYDFSGCSIEKARFIKCPEGNYQYIGANHPVGVIDSNKIKPITPDETPKDNSSAKSRSK